MRSNYEQDGKICVALLCNLSSSTQGKMVVQWKILLNDCQILLAGVQALKTEVIEHQVLQDT